MSQERYRVIQWATGTVGMAALRHFIENPAIDLVGLWVTNPGKIGRDAAEVASGYALGDTGDARVYPDTGVIATDDVEALIALDADCVHMSQLSQDLDLICRLLRSGKNVISALGPYYPNERHRDQFDRIEAACLEGGTSFHGCGVHPGFAGDLLPLTLTRLMNRVDRIEISEIIDKVRNPMIYIEVMGFGLDPDELRTRPRRSPEAPHVFAQSMALVVEGLGKKIERLTTNLELAVATEDTPYYNGVIRKGTVGGQHFEWTAWVDGAPFITYHFYWSMGENLEPRWEHGGCKYRVRIEGDPPLEVHMMGGQGPTDTTRSTGYPGPG